MSTDNHIDQQAYSEAQMLELVHTALQPFLKQWITQVQIVHATGLSVWQVEDALRVWMDHYPSRLDVNEKGELLYWFDWSRTRQTEPSIFRQVLDFIGFILVFLLKLWIVFMVYTYGLIYVTLASFAFAVAGKSPGAFFAPFYAFGISLKSLFMGIVGYFKKDGKTEAAEEETNIIHQVFAFIFGTPQPNDRLETERRVLDYLRSHRYVLTRADLVLMMGWGWEKADEEITRLISHYRGEPKVSEEGVIYVVFPEVELSEKAATLLKTPEEDSWDRHYCWKNPLPTEDPYLPPSGVAYFILTMIFLLTLVGSVIHCLFIKPDFADFYRFSFLSFFPNKHYFASFWSSYFSLFFVVIILIISAFRQAKYEALYQQNKLRNHFFNFIKNLYHGMPLLPANATSFSERQIWDRLRVDLRGEPTNLENGDLAYQFQDFYAEWRTAAAFRGEEKPREGALKPIGSEPRGSSPVLWLAAKLFFLGLAVLIAFLPRITLREASSCSRLRDIPEDEFEDKFVIPDPIEAPCYAELLEKLVDVKHLHAVLFHWIDDYSLAKGRVIEWKPQHVKTVCKNQNLLRVVIERVPYLFPALDELPPNSIKQWILSKNAIAKMPSFVRKSPTLEKLYFHENPELTDLGADWSAATSLYEIELSSENVADFSPLATAPELSHLSVSDCDEEGFRQICRIEQLESLTISFADFTKIPSDIKNLKKLRYLKMHFRQDCTLERLPKELLKLPELKSVSLRSLQNFEELQRQVKAAKVDWTLDDDVVGGMSSDPWRYLPDIW